MTLPSVILQGIKVWLNVCQCFMLGFRTSIQHFARILDVSRDPASDAHLLHVGSRTAFRGGSSCRRRASARDAKAAAVVETDPTELRQWAGAWVGAWGATLKHVLLVESVTADGLARVVYAIGDNPWLGIRRGWSRHEATLSGRRLTISQAGFSAIYEPNDQGGLNATDTRGKIVSHAAMTKTDLTTLSVPDAVIPWTRGKSELLRTLIEDGKPVNLEVGRAYLAQMYRRYGNWPDGRRIPDRGRTLSRSRFARWRICRKSGNAAGQQMAAEHCRTPRATLRERCFNAAATGRSRIPHRSCRWCRHREAAPARHRSPPAACRRAGAFLLPRSRREPVAPRRA
jgi:hypothetical protein